MWQTSYNEDVHRASRYVGVAGFGILSVISLAVALLDHPKTISAPVPIGLLTSVAAICSVFVWLTYRYSFNNASAVIVQVTAIALLFIFTSRDGLYSAAGALIRMVSGIVAVPRGRVFIGLAYSAAAIWGLYLHLNGLLHEAAQLTISDLVFLPIFLLCLVLSFIKHLGRVAEKVEYE